MITTELNKKGHHISYDFISSNKIRITTHSVPYQKSIIKDDIIMLDYDGGPVLTVGAALPFYSVNSKITKIEIMNTDYEHDEVIVYV